MASEEVEKIIQKAFEKADEKIRQEDFVDNVMPEIVRFAGEYGMQKVAGYLIGMAVGFAGEAGFDEWQIIKAIIENVNARRCIKCGLFQVHMHDGVQHP